jgi:hypothetical protein
MGEVFQAFLSVRVWDAYMTDGIQTAVDRAVTSIGRT